MNLFRVNGRTTQGGERKYMHIHKYELAQTRGREYRAGRGRTSIWYFARLNMLGLFIVRMFSSWNHVSIKKKKISQYRKEQLHHTFEEICYYKGDRCLPEKGEAEAETGDGAPSRGRHTHKRAWTKDSLFSGDLVSGHF